MFNSLLLIILAISATNVTSFAPSTQFAARAPAQSTKITQLSPMSVVERNSLFQSRPKSLSIYVLPETGFDPMIITMIFSAGLLACMAQYAAEENESTANSGKTLVADSPAKVEAAPSPVVMQTAKVSLTKNNDPVVSSRKIAVSKPVDITALKESKPADIVSVAVEVEVEESKSVSTCRTSFLAKLATGLALKFSLFAKVLVKLLMPWRKFATI